MKYNKKKSKIEDWILYTKLGHFIIVFGLCVLVELILLIFYPKLFFYAMISSLLPSIFMCINDDNKRWV